MKTHLKKSFEMRRCEFNFLKVNEEDVMYQVFTIAVAHMANSSATKKEKWLMKRWCESMKDGLFLLVPIKHKAFNAPCKCAVLV